MERLRDAKWRYSHITLQERVKRLKCLSTIRERGQKRASKEGGGGISFSVSLKREWGKGGWAIMQARAQMESILTDSYSICIVYVITWVSQRKMANREDCIMYARDARVEFCVC